MSNEEVFVEKMKEILLNIYDDLVDTTHPDGPCPVCMTYTHKQWCWWKELEVIVSEINCDETTDSHEVEDDVFAAARSLVIAKSLWGNESAPYRESYLRLQEVLKKNEGGCFNG